MKTLILALVVGSAVIGPLAAEDNAPAKEKPVFELKAKAPAVSNVLRVKPSDSNVASLSVMESFFNTTVAPGQNTLPPA